jgi:transcription antitermination factor NusG
MIESKNWYAVYTRPRWEKKLAGILTRSKIENYCPLNSVNRQWSDRKKITLEPLFASCLFVRVSEAEQALLKETEGVVNMIYWLGKPVVIPDVEIEMIKNFLSECTNVRLEKRPIFINDRVPVIAGSLTETELEGDAIGLKTRTIKIMLPSLGYIMQAEVETGNVKVIESGISQQYEMKADRYAFK